jgi:hypothetical protein
VLTDIETSGRGGDGGLAGRWAVLEWGDLPVGGGGESPEGRMAGVGRKNSCLDDGRLFPRGSDHAPLSSSLQIPGAPFGPCPAARPLPAVLPPAAPSVAEPIV